MKRSRPLSPAASTIPDSSDDDSDDDSIPDVEKLHTLRTEKQLEKKLIDVKDKLAAQKTIVADKDHTIARLKNTINHTIPLKGKLLAAHKTIAAKDHTIARLKDTIVKVAEEFKCPLTCDMPIQPVMSSTGYLFDPIAFGKFHGVKKNDGGDFLCPVTKQKMKINPWKSTILNNVAEHIARSGILTGDVAEKWNEKIDLEKKIETMKKKAEAGDAKSMNYLGVMYAGGTGVEKNQDKANEWYKKAYKNGCNHGRYNLGQRSNNTERMGYDTNNYHNGHGASTVRLGFTFANGEGVEVDKDTARKYLTEALEMSDDTFFGDDHCHGKNKAREWLANNPKDDEEDDDSDDV